MFIYIAPQLPHSALAESLLIAEQVFA